MLLTQTPKQRLNQSPVSTLHHPYDPLLHLNQQKVSKQTVKKQFFEQTQNFLRPVKINSAHSLIL